jgi:SPP1 gp7 family putative phage head morphogenesis protein
LRTVIHGEFVDMVLPRIIDELERSGDLVAPRRADALRPPNLAFLGGIVTERLKTALISAARGVVHSARTGVARALRPERATRIPTNLPAESQIEAAYVQRVVGSVVDGGLARGIVRVFEGATLGEDIRGQIAQVVLGAAERVANIAKAETQELHADYTQRFARTAGVKKYVWTSQLDEVVRPGHSLLEGTIQRWDDPPVTDENGYRAHPGEPRNCRCIAFPWDDGE